MTKQYSIAEAKDHFASVVREAEAGTAVEVTRRGKSVAVILSAGEFARFRSRKPPFRALYSSWRERVQREGWGFAEDAFKNVRDKTPGREFRW